MDTARDQHESIVEAKAIIDHQNLNDMVDFLGVLVVADCTQYLLHIVQIFFCSMMGWSSFHQKRITGSQT